MHIHYIISGQYMQLFFPYRPAGTIVKQLHFIFIYNRIHILW